MKTKTPKENEDVWTKEGFEKELEKMFPKGDKARGRALVLLGYANILFQQQAKEYELREKVLVSDKIKEIREWVEINYVSQVLREGFKREFDKKFPGGK
jgi:hypothetical protein